MVLVAAAVFAKNGTKPGKGWFTSCILPQPLHDDITSSLTTDNQTRPPHTHIHAYIQLCCRDSLWKCLVVAQRYACRHPKQNKQSAKWTVNHAAHPNPRCAICCSVAALQGLLASFPKLITSTNAQHTYVETDMVRCVQNHMLSVVAVCTTMPFA